MTLFIRSYHDWVESESAIQIFLVFLILFFPAAWAPAAVANALLMPVLLAAAVRRETGDPVRMADAVTALRFLITAVGAFLVTVDFGVPVVVVVLFGIGACSDLVDGYLARRSGPTRFGATWDMESDAAYGAAMAHVLVVVLGYPAVVLLIGLMRYLFFLVIGRNPATVSYPVWYQWYAKSVAAAIATVQVAAMVLAVVNLFAVGTLLLVVVLFMQLSSFAIEWVYLRRNRP